MSDRVLTTTVRVASGKLVEADVKELGAWGTDVLRRLVLSARWVETGLSVPEEVKAEVVTMVNADLQ